jgi:hypothetical protein
MYSNSQGACLAQAPEVAATELAYGFYRRFTGTAPVQPQAQN